MMLLNVEARTDGTIRPRKGFKTFNGFVYQMWILNRRYKKMGIRGSFTVTLPLPEKEPVTSYFATTQE